MQRFRQPVNGFTHLAAAILSVIALIWLIFITRSEPLKIFSVLIYGLSLITLYVSSTVYHLSHGSPRTLLWLERIDHAAIYILIAGSYTPFCLLVITGEWRWILLILVWIMALIGVVYKLFFLTRPGLFSLLYYLLMACVVFIAPPSVILMIPQQSIVLLLASGAVFVVGALIFGLEKPNPHPLLGHHELWHIFVMVGSTLHFVSIVYCLI